MNILTRKALCLGCAFSLSALLAACGPDDSDTSTGDTYSLLDTMAPLDWPVGGMPLGDGGYLNQNLAPIPASAPMMRYAREGSGYAPGYDYGSAPYYDEGYYGDGPYYDDSGYYDDDRYYDYGYDDSYYGYADSGFYDSAPSLDGLGLLAVVALLGGVLDNSPPDYYFDYGGTRPWAWHTDRYVRYAEPIRSGYRYYYYEPGVARPFLVRDPNYSYGYRNDRLVAIYDRDGRVLDNHRAWKQRRAAIRHFNRARRLHLAARNRPHHRVSVSRWNERKATIIRDQRRWRKKHQDRIAWRKWNNNHEKAIRAHWPQKHTTRADARDRFHNWRQAETRRFRKETRETPQIRKVAERRHKMFRKAAAYRRHEAQVERRREQAKERVRDRRSFDRIARDRRREARQRVDRNDRIVRRRTETRQAVQARRQTQRQAEERRQKVRAERVQTQRQAQQRASARRQEARAQRQAQARRQAQRQAEERRQKARAERQARTQRQAQQRANARRQEARAQRQAQARRQAQRQAEERRQEARAERQARTQRQAQQRASARRQEAHAQRQAQARRQAQAHRQQVRAQRQERSRRNDNRQRAVRAAFRDRKGR